MQAALCSPLTLSAAFVVGMAGSVHCLAMCGGIAGALGMRSRGVPGSSASLHALLYQLGRLTSYSLAGAIVGACGGFLAAMFDVDEIALVARTVAGLVLISVALSVLFGWRPLAHLERLGGHVWSRLAPLARTLPAGGAAGSLLLGMLWGWLPCGFVYSMLIVSALTGSAVQSAAMMLCFGLGTAPAVFGLSMVSARLRRITIARGVNRAAGWLLLLFGALTVLAPFSHAHH